MSRAIAVLIIIAFSFSALFWFRVNEDVSDRLIPKDNMEETILIEEVNAEWFKHLPTRQEVFTDVNREQEYSIANKMYFPDNDCASDIVLELYNYIDSDPEGRDWLDKRGYTLFYSGYNLIGYRKLSQSDLKVLANGNDALAMYQLADGMDWKQEREAKDLLEKMLIRTGNFTAINKIISFNSYSEKPNMKPLIKYYDEWLTWVALNKKLNGLLFIVGEHNYDLIEDKHNQLADEKLKHINEERYFLGLDNLPTNPLPNHLYRNVENYFRFVEKQEALGIDSFENCEDDTHIIEEIKRASSEDY